MATTAINHPIHAWIAHTLKVGGPPHVCTLLGDKKIIKSTVEYIEKTGRFKLEH
jgi:hypothetical protein